MRRAALLAICVLGVARDMRGQCPDGSPPPCGTRAPAAPAPNSVAVMAFENRSRDSADLYLTEGFQDEISTRLGEIARLTIISTSVVRRLRDPDAMPLDQVGRSLRARYLVMGNFQRSRDRLHVTVQLARAQTGVQVWQQSYDTRGDALQIQSDVAVQVASAILARLLPSERTALAAAPTRNPAAWDHFQRGNHFLALRTAANIDSALTEYEAAVVADSTFIRARARIGYAVALMRSAAGAWRGLRGDSLVAVGLVAADDALRRDSTSSDGWMARAYLIYWINATTFNGVREAFERSVRLDPRNTEAWHQYGSALWVLGYDDDALRAFRRALDLEPGRAITYRERAFLFYRRGDIGQAKAMSDSGLAIDSTPQSQHYRIQTAAGDTAMLRRMLANARRLNATATAGIIRSRLALLRGDTAEARAALPPNPGAANLAAVGLLDSALTVLEGNPPSVISWWILYDPDYRPLSTNPRFLAIRASMRPAAANPALPR